jgi:Domain of unknown function (DUF4148)
MKTLIAAATLSLISAVAFAKIAPTAAVNNPSPVQYLFEGDTLTPAYTAPLTRTRAEVIAELKASQQRMDYVFMGDTWVPRSVFMSERSREEVRAGESRH